MQYQVNDLVESGFVRHYLLDCPWNASLTFLKGDKKSFFWTMPPFCSPPTNKHVHTYALASTCQSEIEFNMAWMVCVYVFWSALWVCILLYANEAGRHRWRAWCVARTWCYPDASGVYSGVWWGHRQHTWLSLKWLNSRWTVRVTGKNNKGVQKFVLCFLAGAMLSCWSPAEMWGGYWAPVHFRTTFLTSQEGIYLSLESWKAFHISTFI